VNSLQQAKYVAAIKPAAIIDDASATAEAIDTRGWDSATSGGVYADITGATFDGGAGMGGAVLALPSATDDGQTCVFQIDLRNKNPFLKVVATFGNGSAGGFIAAVCVLSRGKIGPVLSTDAADGDVCRVV
jgi:hypothetical protein